MVRDTRQRHRPMSVRPQGLRQRSTTVKLQTFWPILNEVLLLIAINVVDLVWHRSRPGISNDRYWKTELDASRYQQLQLPRKIEEYDPPLGTLTCRWVSAIGNRLYAIFDNAVYKYTPTAKGSGVWSASLGLLVGDVTDKITSTVNEAMTFVAYGGGMVIINPDHGEGELEVTVRQNCGRTTLSSATSRPGQGTSMVYRLPTDCSISGTRPHRIGKRLPTPIRYRTLRHHLPTSTTLVAHELCMRPPPRHST